MDAEKARDTAEIRVYVYMNRGDIEQECLNRGIPITKDRSTMEKKLIEALVKELVTQ